MPELPEVETTRRGISPHILNRRITDITVRNPQLRWPVAPELGGLTGQAIQAVGRRGKYLLLTVSNGTLLVHLGMSGSLRICEPQAAMRPHDHIRLAFEHGIELRFHDPRRFGSWLWGGAQPLAHPLLCDLGPEPLSAAFTAEHLHAAARGRRVPIKSLLMDAKVVVGVGNIYANEALFAAGIDPRRPAAQTHYAELQQLCEAIRQILAKAIAQGGTTLRDFLREDGNPGYFRQQLNVYDRTGQQCRRCGAAIHSLRLAQRSTFFCPHCQH